MMADPTLELSRDEPARGKRNKNSFSYFTPDLAASVVPSEEQVRSNVKYSGQKPVKPLWMSVTPSNPGTSNQRGSI
jgi:hypothetical protein